MHFNLIFKIMKNVRKSLSLLAFALAVGIAFAFKPSPDLLSPGYTDGSGHCNTATASCIGSSSDCRVDIPEVAGTAKILIKDFDSGCATNLQMD